MGALRGNSRQTLEKSLLSLILGLQGNGTADGYGNFVGTGSMDSYDGYFQGTGTFAGAGDCEGSQVYSS